MFYPAGETMAFSSVFSILLKFGCRKFESIGFHLINAVVNFYG